MDVRITRLIKREDLDNCITIEFSQILYNGAKVVGFETHWPNNTPFKHSNGDTYGIAFLNAFTKTGMEEIVSSVSSYPNKSIKEIEEIIEKNRLKKYINGNVQAFTETFIGDLGSIYMDDINDYKSVRFSNLSVIDRVRNKA